MLKNDKASIVLINVLSYDEELDSYLIQYEVKIRSGIIRRRKAFYSFSENLSEEIDRNNKELIERIKQEIKLFNLGVKSRKR